MVSNTSFTVGAYTKPYEEEVEYTKPLENNLSKISSVLEKKMDSVLKKIFTLADDRYKSNTDRKIFLKKILDRLDSLKAKNSEYMHIINYLECYIQAEYDSYESEKEVDIDEIL
jgi:hypothetical protein